MEHRWHSRIGSSLRVAERAFGRRLGDHAVAVVVALAPVIEARCPVGL